VFTGAGVSTESGISDFRSPDGIWSRYDPKDFTIQRFVSDKDARKRNWQFRRELVSADYKPNPAHFAVAELEKLGKLSCVITQNIDGLHHAAGNSEEKIVELHGTIKYAKCLECDDRLPLVDVLKRIEDGEEDPHCKKCDGLLKAATVSFGEAMPIDEMNRSGQCSKACDLFIVIGSSLVVFPAANMPVLAKRTGAILVIINYTSTDMDSMADVVIHEKAGVAMNAIIDKIKQNLS
ncbi:MAG: Sir2 family NAD-dependent protein deacetylase, partial [Desulfobacterales bacterium]|nr:Sir2 family NAD-dependent protein deacetylase [Desulfobacterales bacterium]